MNFLFLTTKTTRNNKTICSKHRGYWDVKNKTPQGAGEKGHNK